MERIVYRKTLDVHKNGIQFMLRGFETADNLSRVIEVSLMASGDAIDFPLSEMVAMMYVTTPSATEPSINECIIKDNKVVYEALPITEEGITTMQLKLIETSVEGATSVLVSPKFAVEVIKSNVDDSGAVQKTTFTALENAVAKAKAVHDSRFLRMELTSDCMFRAYYADGTEYETDILKQLFHNGNVLLSESYAHGGTGVRAGEDTDNSMYYSNVSRSEALNAKRIMEDSEEILEEVKLHGVYTAFKVDFESGEVVYVSPSYQFKVNLDTGELDAEGKTFTFEDEIGRLVTEWLEKNGVSISNLTTTVNEHTKKLSDLTTTVNEHGGSISALEEEVTPIEKGGTGATTLEEAKANLGIGQSSFEVKITTDSRVNPSSYNTFSTETSFEEISEAVESGKRVFARFYRTDGTILFRRELPLFASAPSVYTFIGVMHYSAFNGDADYLYSIKIDTDSSVTVTCEKRYEAEQKSFEVRIIAENIGGIGLYDDVEYSIETSFEEICTAAESGRRVFARVYNTDGSRGFECEFPLHQKNSAYCLFFGTVYRSYHEGDMKDQYCCFSVKSDSSVKFYTKLGETGEWTDGLA